MRLLHSWLIESLAARFDRLEDFVGGLASPYLHTATAEYHLSVVQWETDVVRSQMEHYLLEGIMQCKEHMWLKAVDSGRKRNVKRIFLKIA